MNLSIEQLATAWKACDVLAVQTLKARGYSPLATHEYTVEYNTLYWEAIALRNEIGIELEKRKAEQERPHREKLAALAEAVRLTPVPSGPGHSEIVRILADAADQICEIATGPLKE
jgi:hypothetical protein